jgi:hypothetical protein
VGALLEALLHGVAAQGFLASWGMGCDGGQVSRNGGRVNEGGKSGRPQRPGKSRPTRRSQKRRAGRSMGNLALGQTASNKVIDYILVNIIR